MSAIQDLWNIILQNLYIQIVLTLGGIYTLVEMAFKLIAYIRRFFHLSSDLVWIRASSVLFDNKHELCKDVRVLYQGNQYNRLTLTRVCLWYTGKRRISNGDISKLHPLCIENLDVHSSILSAKIVHCNSENDVFIHDTGEKIVLGFDYFAPKEGAVIQILHTGDGLNLFLTGKIGGGSSVKGLISWQSNDSHALFVKFLHNHYSLGVYFIFVFIPVLIATIVSLIFGVWKLAFFIYALYICVIFRFLRDVPKKLRCYQLYKIY